MNQLTLPHKMWWALALSMLAHSGCMRNVDLEACTTPQDCFQQETCQRGVCIASSSTQAPTTPGMMQAPTPDSPGLIATGMSLPGPRSSAAHSTPLVLGYRPEEEGTLYLLTKNEDTWRPRTVRTRLRWDDTDGREHAMIHAYGDELYGIVYEDLNASGSTQVHVSFFDARKDELSQAYPIGRSHDAGEVGFDMFVSEDTRRMAFLISHGDGMEFIYSSSPLVWRATRMDLAEGAHHTPRFLEEMTQVCAITALDTLECAEISALLEQEDDDDDERLVRMLSKPGVSRYEIFSEKRDRVIYEASRGQTWRWGKLKADKDGERVKFDKIEGFGFDARGEVSLASMSKEDEFALSLNHEGQTMCVTQKKNRHIERLEVAASRSSAVYSEGRLHHFSTREAGLFYTPLSVD